MVKKILICDACQKEESWDNAYIDGRPAIFSINLFSILWKDICHDCARKAERALINVFR